MEQLRQVVGGGPFSARQRAYEGIRARILEGVFAPGTFVEEVAVAEVMGVSRSPVREALNRLAAEGYLDLHPRRGAMVRSLVATELRDFWEVRMMIESRAMEKICDERRPLPAELDALCERQEAISAEDLLASVEVNWLFHRAIVAAAGNNVLVQVFDSLRANLARVAMLSRQSSVGEGDVIRKEHRDMVAALKAHDRVAALELLERHLRLMPRLVAALAT